MFKTLEFTTTINAPKEKVRNTMLADETYRKWTAAFSPGSWYEGDRSQGSEILFLGSDPSNPGQVGGMYSKIAVNKSLEMISIEHLGEVSNGVKQANAAWAGAHENYYFSEQDGVTTLKIEIDVEQGPEGQSQDGSPDFVAMFSEMRPRALTLLKQLCEQSK